MGPEFEEACCRGRCWTNRHRARRPGTLGNILMGDGAPPGGRVRWRLERRSRNRPERAVPRRGATGILDVASARRSRSSSTPCSPAAAACRQVQAPRFAIRPQGVAARRPARSALALPASRSAVLFPPGQTDSGIVLEGAVVGVRTARGLAFGFDTAVAARIGVRRHAFGSILGCVSSRHTTCGARPRRYGASRVIATYNRGG